MRAWKSVTITAAATGALVLGLTAPPALAHDDDNHGTGNTVLLQDRCDPATFNAAIGPGTCVTTNMHHRVTFQKFFDRLLTHPTQVLQSGNDRGWRNDPSALTLKTGSDLLAKNTGGETHTFTLLSNFGGGCVPPINAPLGLTLNPVCATPAFGASIVLPGTTLTVKALKAGTYRYECLIHPWMRTTVTVSDTATATIGDDDDD